MSFASRRKFLQVAAGIVATGAVVLVEDTIILEPNRPILKSIEVELTRLPAAFDGFTIVQLSDFHYDVFSAVPMRAAIEIVNRLRPDLIVLTGDFVTVPPLHRRFHTAKRAARASEPCAALLSELRSLLGIVAVLGNHDVDANAPMIIHTLDSHGIPVLRNRSMPIEKDRSRIWLCGLDSVWEGDPDMDLALRGVPSDEAGCPTGARAGLRR